MPSICFYFQVHQPRRIKRYRIFDIGKDSSYFTNSSESNLNNRRVIEKVARKCYLPMNRLLLELLKKYPDFKVSFSFSGIFLEQLEEFMPETLRSFQSLIETGRAEVLSETYYHSLAFLYSAGEFERQVRMHAGKIRTLFGVKPKVFRNTELIYNNDLSRLVEKMGYKGILAEGADHLLGWRSPNFLYRPKGARRLALFLKNYRLSDDIAFRFSEKSWSEFPLTAYKYSQWLSAHNGDGELINLFMDYETFGEHQWEDSGIFDFMRSLPGEVLRNPDNNFVTPSEAVRRYKPVGEVDAPHFVSWADIERDISAWRGNPMQHDALNKLYEMENAVLESGDKTLAEDWRRLQTSDHFYYMCTKWFADGDVHKYFNPYESPYEAFISFMNALSDVKLRLQKTRKVDIEKMLTATQ